MKQFSVKTTPTLFFYTLPFYKNKFLILWLLFILQQKSLSLIFVMRKVAFSCLKLLYPQYLWVDLHLCLPFLQNKLAYVQFRKATALKKWNRNINCVMLYINAHVSKQLQKISRGGFSRCEFGEEEAEMTEERHETMDQEMTEHEECSSQGRLSDLPDSCG